MAGRPRPRCRSVPTDASTSSEIRGTTIQGGEPAPGAPNLATGWEAAWYRFCYAPLILWAPLPVALTVAYWKRLRAAGNAPAEA